MGPEERQQLERMFNPRGFAFFGGIDTPASFGHLVLLSHIRYGYKGCLYPISAKGGEIAGFKIYKRLSDVKDRVDLASISVPCQGRARDPEGMPESWCGRGTDPFFRFC